jgi:hypothetical protein
MSTSACAHDHHTLGFAARGLFSTNHEDAEMLHLIAAAHFVLQADARF